MKRMPTEIINLVPLGRFDFIARNKHLTDGLIVGILQNFLNFID